MHKLIPISEYSTILYQTCEHHDDEGYDEEKKILYITEESLHHLEILTNETKFAEIYHDRIRTLNYAGVAKVGSIKIEILPKFFDNDDISADKQKIMNNLLYMLQHSNLFNFKELDSADLDIKNDFLEVMVYLFAKNLTQLLKNQQDRQYVTCEDDLRFVREKIITQQYSSNPARLHIIPCRFHERSINTLVNQTIKFTAFLLVNLVNDQETYRYLKYILSILDAVDLVQIYPSDIKKIYFNRLNKSFRPYTNFCELFLRHSTLTLQASNVEFFSLMIPMEKLFENFITQMILVNPAVVHQVHPRSIQPQKFIGHLAYEDERGLFEMKPDIIINGPETLIIDTKYKILDPEDGKNKISQSDLYQMYAYCRESGANSAVLLYPEGINYQVPDRTFKLGKDRDITLHIKTIPLHYDLSKEEGVKEFVNQLMKTFDFLKEGTNVQMVQAIIREIPNF